MNTNLRPPKAQAIKDRREALRRMIILKRLDEEMDKAAAEYREQMAAHDKWKRDMLIASYQEYEPPAPEPGFFRTIINFIKGY